MNGAGELRVGGGNSNGFTTCTTLDDELVVVGPAGVALLVTPLTPNSSWSPLEDERRIGGDGTSFRRLPILGDLFGGDVCFRVGVPVTPTCACGDSPGNEASIEELCDDDEDADDDEFVGIGIVTAALEVRGAPKGAAVG